MPSAIFINEVLKRTCSGSTKKKRRGREEKQEKEVDEFEDGWELSGPWALKKGPDGEIDAANRRDFMNKVKKT